MKVSRRAGLVRLAAVLTLPALLLTAGCDEWGGGDIFDGGSDRGEIDRGGGAGGEAMSEAEVIGLARMINRGEVDHATAARDRLSGPGAKSFAERMIQDHGDALTELDRAAQSRGITPLEGDDAQRLSQDVMQMIDDLDQQEGEEIDETFLADQEKLHERALRTMEEDLLPAVTDSELRQLLEQQRATIKTHLDMVQQLRKGEKQTR